MMSSPDDEKFWVSNLKMEEKVMIEEIEVVANLL